MFFMHLSGKHWKEVILYSSERVALHSKIEPQQLSNRKEKDMRRKSSFLLLVILSIIVFLPCLIYAQAAKKPAAEMKSLKVGVISPQSGPIAYFGMSVLRGSEVAIKNINAKGTIGKGPGILVGNQRYKL